MKKVLTIIAVFFLLIMIFAFTTNKMSYSFFKEFFIKSNPKIETQNEERNIVDIEDLIYIPPLKNFKKIFLKKINTSHIIEVKIPENILYFYKYNLKENKYSLLKKYPVAVGKPRTKSPIGEGIIYTKGHVFFKYRYGTNQGKIVEYANNGKGGKTKIPYYKMYGLYMTVDQSDAYVIHSTTEDWKMGEAVSGGCVRMLIPDMIKLYRYIKPPIKVIINYSLFKLEDTLLTIYPDIYKKQISLYLALMEFFKEKNINPIIFNQDKIRKTLFNKLPTTISLNDILHDYFIERKITYDQIKLKYGEVLKKNNDIAKINEFFIQNKKQ